MALPDLLQWLATARMSGTLRVERNKVSKSILLENGAVVGCSSDDPPERLGQFLLARGKISEDQLRQALEIQERERKHLGMILVEMGALSPDELSSHLEAKAEETIYSLFDWQDAVFRFQQGETDQANIFPVSLAVEEVLLRGLKRFDEVRRIREVLDDPAIVLRHTEKNPPGEVFANRMARALYESIDGERTVADILLHVHGSEYVVTKFLFELHRNRFVEIAGVKAEKQPAASPAEPQPAAPPGADPQAVATPPDAAGPGSFVPPPVESALDTGFVPPPVDSPSLEAATLPTPAPEPPPAAAAMTESAVQGGQFDAPAQAPAPAAPQAEPVAPALAAQVAVEPPPEPESPDLQLESVDRSAAYSLSQRLEQARQLMSAAEFEPALTLLDQLYREYPGDESLRRMTAEAEAAFAEKAYRHFLPPAKVPVLIRPMEELEAENLSPTEFFLLSRIDGVWNLKSIIQVAPLREADCLRTLKRLRESGVIDLRDPE